MHEYSVDFMIAGDTLDESEISAMFGLKASVFLKKGDPFSPLSPQKVRDSSSWSIFFDPPGGNRYWQSLDAGLKCLIEKLLPSKEILQELGSRFSLHAYCGHFGSGFGGGPTISTETLHMLGELGLALTIKTYWGSTEPDS
jgi:hypothetical protein